MYNFYGGFRGRDFVFKAVYPNKKTMLEKGATELNLGEFCLINFFWDSESQTEVYTDDWYNTNRGEEPKDLHNTLWMKNKDGNFKQIFSFEPLAVSLLGDIPEDLDLIISGGTSVSNVSNNLKEETN